MNIENNKWLTLFSTGIMILLVNLDMTIINLALPEISAYFKANMNQAQWIIASYLLATTLSFIVFGRLADHWGHKKIFLFGTILFTLSSLVAGLSKHLSILLLARFFQGLGFAATLGLSIVLIVDAFPEHQKGTAAGTGITISGLAQAIGPTLGGIILQYAHWQWVFLINVPLGILSCLMTAKFVRPDQKKFTRSLPFSATNAALFTLSLAIVLVMINQWNVFNGKIIAFSLLLGAGMLVFFIRDCHKNSRALLDLSLLANRNFVYIVFLRFCFMILMASMLFILPLYLQNILNYSAFDAGLILLAMTCVIAVSSPIVGKLLDEVSFVWPLIISLIFALCSTLLMLFFTADISFVLLITTLLLFGLAIGFHVSSSMNGALTQTPKEKSGTAVGLFFTLAIAGATIGVALSGILVNTLSHRFLTQLITQENMQLSSEQLINLFRVAEGTANIRSIGLNNAQILYYRHCVYNAFMHALHVEMGLLSLLMLLAVVGSLGLRRRPQMCL